jgi:hypothetical protein
MRRLIAVLLLGSVALLVLASSAVAKGHKTRACKAADKAGNVEVVIARAATAKAAGSMKARAVAKGLHVTVERDGCARRYEVLVTVASKAKAVSVERQARKDGFTAVTTEKS